MGAQPPREEPLLTKDRHRLQNESKLGLENLLSGAGAKRERKASLSDYVTVRLRVDVCPSICMYVRVSAWGVSTIKYLRYADARCICVIVAATILAFLHSVADYEVPCLTAD